MSSLPLRLVSCIGWRAAFQPFTPSLLQVVKDHTAVAALTRLTSLMHLAVGGRVFVDKAAGLMAQLTQLQFLEWVHTDVTSRGLHALTALTNLDTLSVLDCPYVREEGLSAIELCTSPEVREGLAGLSVLAPGLILALHAFMPPSSMLSCFNLGEPH